jgi:hypothetical protein
VASGRVEKERQNQPLLKDSFNGHGSIIQRHSHSFHDIIFPSQLLCIIFALRPALFVVALAGE